ncbi:MAG: methylmalonyl-CoA epimerase [Rhodobacteraceae bacterium]|nr:methylmalonyl-CoA epimerase [Paracoccaceae bacterium]
MIGALNHVAVVVPDLSKACRLYESAFGCTPSPPVAVPEHGVTVVFIELSNTKIELLEPLGAHSPVRKFLERNPAGGIHHICLEVPDMDEAVDRVAGAGVRVLGDGSAAIGAHGKPVLFLHPRDCLGTLVELEEA